LEEIELSNPLRFCKALIFLTIFPSNRINPHRKYDHSTSYGTTMGEFFDWRSSDGRERW